MMFQRSGVSIQSAANAAQPLPVPAQQNNQKTPCEAQSNHTSCYNPALPPSCHRRNSQTSELKPWHFLRWLPSLLSSQCVQPCSQSHPPTSLFPQTKHLSIHHAATNCQHQFRSSDSEEVFETRNSAARACGSLNPKPQSCVQYEHQNYESGPSEVTSPYSHWRICRYCHVVEESVHTCGRTRGNQRRGFVRSTFTIDCYSYLFIYLNFFNSFQLIYQCSFNLYTISIF